MPDRELLLLLRHLASVQRRIDYQVRVQQQEIARLNEVLMQTRAALILSITRCHWLGYQPSEPVAAPVRGKQPPLAVLGKLRQQIGSTNVDTRNTISALAADLVICQSGCLSHDAYWRVQAYCRRHGKRCLLVEAEESNDIAALLPLPESSKA